MAMTRTAAVVACLLAPALLRAADEAKPVLSAEDHTCKPDGVPLLILGSFHMDSSGQDTWNPESDDPQGPKKQKEIAAVLDRLATFRPTKLAIEAPLTATTWPDRYLKYRAGEYELGKNEIEQIGFRLAKRLGHTAVFPVDFSMWMDGRVPAEIGTPKPRPVSKDKAPAAEAAPEPPAFVKQMMKVIKEGTLGEALRLVNREDSVRHDQQFYVEGLRPDPYSNALYGNTDPVANWYKRNLRIFTNVYRIAEPGDRVLLLIGSGHNAILRRLAIDSGDFCLVDTLAYLP